MAQVLSVSNGRIATAQVLTSVELELRNDGIRLVWWPKLTGLTSGCAITQLLNHNLLDIIQRISVSS